MERLDDMKWFLGKLADILHGMLTYPDTPTTTHHHISAVLPKRHLNGTEEAEIPTTAEVAARFQRLFNNPSWLV